MEITREQFRERAREKVKSLEFSITQTAFADSRAELEEELELARIALASLEAEPVAWRNKDSGHCWTVLIQGKSPIDCGYEPLYLAPPAPVSVQDESAVELLATDLMKRIDKITGERHSVATLSSLRVSIVEACRAAMLQGAEPVSNRDELADAVNCLLAVMDEYPESLVPINRDSAVVRQLRSAAGG